MEPLSNKIHTNSVSLRALLPAPQSKSHTGFIEQIAPWILDQVVHTYPEIISVISFTS
ncbi:hypothetical protein [Rikenella microfusus]|uniref:Uncharacterized protein n=1 Tax=Rikenella microfusus TaxID=28139 RepID=A0A379MS83_9BACT|nr:hypothetical protein [Rikenella microfusus]SUE34488.1 Uncharacterised protein [Rikenella microfusus]